MTPLFDDPGLLISEAPGLIVILMRRSPGDPAFAECGNRIREVPIPETVQWLRAVPGQVPGVLGAPYLTQDLARLLAG